MVAMVTLHFRYEHPDETPMTGAVEFQAPPLRIPADDLLIDGPVTVVLDDTGAGSVTLIATDDPGTEPTGFTYQVTPRLHDAVTASFAIALPAASPDVQLADIAPTAPLPGDYVLVAGPPGPNGLSAYEVALGQGFVGSAAQWLASLVGAPGASGSTYQHVQTTPAATWQVAHGLHHYPTISVIDQAGIAGFTDVEHASSDLAVLTFPAPIAGTATCS